MADHAQRFGPASLRRPVRGIGTTPDGYGEGSWRVERPPNPNGGVPDFTGLRGGDVDAHGVQISKLEFVDSETEDEEQAEEKDQEPGTSQSTSPPLASVLPSTSYSAPATVADSVSSPAFNQPPPCLSPISEKSALSSPPSMSNVKGKVRIDAPSTVLYTADLPTNRQLPWGP